MNSAGYLCGGGPRLEKYQIGETISDPGVPLEAAALADVDGVAIHEQDEGLMSIGLGLEAVTRLTAQQSDNSDPQRLITVDVRPDIILRARMCGGQTSGTALSEFTNTAASTDGTTLTFSGSQAVYDDGYAIGATGANAGAYRKITAVTTTATAVIPFQFDVAANDTFYLSTVGPGERAGVGLTTDWTEVDVTDDEQDENNFRVVRWGRIGPKGQRGATESFLHMVFCEHIFRFSGTAAS